MVRLCGVVCFEGAWRLNAWALRWSLERCICLKMGLKSETTVTRLVGSRNPGKWLFNAWIMRAILSLYQFISKWLHVSISLDERMLSLIDLGLAAKSVVRDVSMARTAVFNCRSSCVASSE